MGLGLGYFIGRRRAVNAVAIGRKIDPNRADRIIRTRLDGEGLSGMNPLEMVFWIITIDRLAIELCYLQGTGPGWFLFASYGRGVESDQRVRLVE